MALKTEDLMKPRYKVIATYPFNNHFLLNEVIELNEFDGREHLAKNMQEYFVIQKSLSGIELPVTMHESTFRQYPHLFKPVQWWKYRSTDEMPNYLKYEEGTIYKAQWEDDNGIIKMNLEGMHQQGLVVIDNVMCFFEPATEQDYLTYQSIKLKTIK